MVIFLRLFCVNGEYQLFVSVQIINTSVQVIYANNVKIFLRYIHKQEKSYQLTYIITNKCGTDTNDRISA